jgi:putative FmdB family regulatory protein
MPIYAYRCGSCGHSKDVLQKVSDAPLTQCPACGAAAFAKQLTAAGFQLKGSGWYVTDFKGGAKAAASKPADGGAAGAASGGSAEPGGSAGSGGAAGGEGKASDSSASAGGCGASCACH